MKKLVFLLSVVAIVAMSSCTKRGNIRDLDRFAEFCYENELLLSDLRADTTPSFKWRYNFTTDGDSIKIYFYDGDSTSDTYSYVKLDISYAGYISLNKGTYETEHVLCFWYFLTPAYFPTYDYMPCDEISLHLKDSTEVFKLRRFVLNDFGAVDPNFDGVKDMRNWRDADYYRTWKGGERTNRWLKPSSKEYKHACLEIKKILLNLEMLPSKDIKKEQRESAREMKKIWHQ